MGRRFGYHPVSHHRVSPHRRVGCRSRRRAFAALSGIPPRHGLDFEIIVYAPDEQTAKRGLDAAFARIEQLNQIFSDYDSESEACRLSHAAPMPEAVPVSAEMFAVLDYSVQLSRQTDGAFDVTVGPVSRLWRRARRQKQMPAPERLQEAMAGVGYQHLQLDAAGRKAKLAAAGMRLDFGVWPSVSPLTRRWQC